MRLITVLLAGCACAMSLSCGPMKTPVAAREAETSFTFPQGEFPIVSWELPWRSSELFSRAGCGLDTLAECGYTTAGFVRPEHLRLCEKLKLKAMIGPAGKPERWRALSDEQIEQRVKQLIADGRNSSCVIGYFITDEPGVGEFPALAKAVAAVKKFAPGKLAYINLYPDYATLGAPDLSQLGTSDYSEYLERFVNEVKPQVISYDNYRVLFSNDLKDPKVAASYYSNLLAVRRVAMKHGLPFWNIASSNQVRPFTPIPSPANLNFQAYTTLAAGAQGMTWFTYYQYRYTYAPVDMEGHRTASWSHLKMVNDQLKVLGRIMRPLKSTDVYFTDPPPVDSLPKMPGELIASIDSKTPLMIGEFAGPDGARYAMIVNLSLEQSTKIQVKPREASELRYVSPVDASLLPLQAENSMWLTAGQGILIKLQ